jgi:tRNA/rRNA methyltransferase
MSLQNCRVVLVRPTIAANIGATARVMRNMGLTDLVLVAPEADPTDPKARQLSTRGEELLHRARTVASLSDALADCRLVIGTSARIGGLFRRQNVGPPDVLLARLVPILPTDPAALVFGPEPSGLTDEEVARCHYLVHIPTDPGYPALNLAQAVAISLYELRRLWLKSETNVPVSISPAPFEMQELMFTRLRSALEAIHFLYGPKADSLMHAVRHLIGRAQPTEMEIEVLLGLARQMAWFAASGGRQPPEVSGS